MLLYKHGYIHHVAADTISVPVQLTWLLFLTPVANQLVNRWHLDSPKSLALLQLKFIGLSVGKNPQRLSMDRNFVKLFFLLIQFVAQDEKGPGNRGL